MAGKTIQDFKKTFDQTDAYYIFYVDDDNYMHFLGDADCVDYDASELGDVFYVDNLGEAILCTYDEAKTLWFLCNYLFPKHHYQIVNVHTTVVWL